MDEEIEQIIVKLDLDETFNEEISLNRLIGNKNAKEIVTTYLNSYQNDLADGKKPELKPILLIYENGSGVHVFARAISNFLGCLQFCTVSGTWLSDRVIGFNQFFWDFEQPFSSYYIHGDKFTSYSQQQLYAVLTTKKLPYYDFAENKWTRKTFSNKLIILSTEKTDNLTSLLVKQFPIQVYLTKLTVEEVALALKQRLALLNLTISSEDFLGQIAQCCSDVGQAMEVLPMGYRIMRSKNEDQLSKSHFNRALHLLDKQFRNQSNLLGI
jgi:hypothetical protein